VSLDVHLCEERIGALFSAGENEYRFAYDPDVVASRGAGAPLLSTALPLRAEPFSAEASSAYVERLLPEGRTRTRLARAVGVEPEDGFGLIASLGRDCSGAVVFLRNGTPASEEGSSGRRWLDQGELEALISGPPRPDSELEVRYSLAGPRHKLALVADAAEHRWGMPSPTIPSTHVVKPEAGEFPDLVRNEMFCMKLARSVGLPVAEAELRTIGGRECLVSRRFDRERGRRVHQEDFCQALGIPPPSRAAGPIEASGPGFAEATGLLRAVGRPSAVSLLLSLAFFNYVIGTGDAHGGNFGLLHESGGSRLAPFYDLASTLAYDLPTHVGLVISEDYDQSVYLLEMGWASEECDLDFDETRKLAATVARRVQGALEIVAGRAQSEGWHAPVIDDIVALASERAAGLGFEADY
jgi:serine/threonine-protein kinase HipA